MAADPARGCAGAGLGRYARSISRPARPLADQVIADVGGGARARLPDAACRAHSTALSATRICASPSGSASSSTAWRWRSRLRKSICAIDAGRVAAQHVVDEADRLDVLPPVDGRAQPQAGDRVGDRRLARGLPLVLGAHDVLGHGVALDQVRFERGAQRRPAHVVLARAVEHLHDVGVVRSVGNRHRRVGRRGVEARDVRVGGAARGAADQELRRSAGAGSRSARA